jgi:hypothetical protein
VSALRKNEMGTFHFFGVRLREAARWSWQRSSWQLANAHCQVKTTKEYLRADRLALRRSPRSRSERIQPEAGATTVALRGADRLAANEDGVFAASTALLCIRIRRQSDRSYFRPNSMERFLVR